MSGILRISTRLAPLVALVFVAACASSSSRVITASAPGVDLTQYRTFGFMQPLSTDQGTTRTIISTHLIESTTRELEMAGFRRDDENPDLLVNFFISTRETISTRPTTSASFHHGRGRYSPWSGYSFGMSTTEIVQRTEGTVDVDLIDRERNRLVWEGGASGRVTDSTRRTMQETLDRAIADIFAQFP